MFIHWSFSKYIVQLVTWYFTNKLTITNWIFFKFYLKSSSFYSTRVLNADDFDFPSQRRNKNISSVEKLRDEFNICIRNWAFYMLKMTRSRNENFQIKNLQMVLNINSFEFDEEANKLNGRLTVVINIRQENQEYKFFKLFNSECQCV